MVEACPVCDTLWRLYSRAVENLHELVGKHGQARGAGDNKTVEILAHEIAISESSLTAVRRELRRHEAAKHDGQQDKQKQQGKEQDRDQKK